MTHELKLMKRELKLTRRANKAAEKEKAETDKEVRSDFVTSFKVAVIPVQVDSVSQHSVALDQVTCDLAKSAQVHVRERQCMLKASVCIQIRQLRRQIAELTGSNLENCSEDELHQLGKMLTHGQGRLAVERTRRCAQKQLNRRLS